MNAPTGKPLYVIELNKGSSLRLAAYSILLIFLGFGIFSGITGHADLGSIGWLILVVYVGTLALHELVHGVAFQFFGGKVNYGVGLASHILPYAYATAPGQAFTLRQMLVVGLSPLVILCTLAVLFALIWPATAPYASVAFIGNFAGAVGDIWLMSQILKFRGTESLAIVDERSGMAIFAKGPKARAVAAELAERQAPTRTLNQLLSAWISASCVLLILGVLIPTLLAIIGYHGHFLLGPPQFPLVDVQNGTKTDSFTLSVFPAIIGGLVFAILKVRLSRRRER